MGKATTYRKHRVSNGREKIGFTFRDGDAFLSGRSRVPRCISVCFCFLADRERRGRVRAKKSDWSSTVVVQSWDIKAPSSTWLTGGSEQRFVKHRMCTFVTNLCSSFPAREILSAMEAAILAIKRRQNRPLNDFGVPSSPGRKILTLFSNYRCKCEKSNAQYSLQFPLEGSFYSRLRASARN